MSPSLASSSTECARLFSRLVLLLQDRECQNRSALQQAAAEDQFERYRIWAGNLGAFQKPTSKASLDNRLRESPKVVAQIHDLLHDLFEALQDVLDIVSGKRPNRLAEPIVDDTEDDFSDEDAEPDPGGQIHAQSTDETDSTPEDDAPLSEAQELFETAKSTITSLFRIALMIRKASPRDRYAQALASAESLIDSTFDTRHVSDKFPLLVDQGKLWLCDRLGRAIAQRRQYLKYTRDHQDRIGKEPAGLWQPDDAPSTYGTNSTPHTAASTLDTPDIPLNTLDFEEAQSQISSVASLLEDKGGSYLRPPRLLDVSQGNNLFECPFCCIVQSFEKENSWQKHVYSDLRPYVCTFAECDLKLFSEERDWFEHEAQHRVKWHCNYCSEDQFDQEQGFREHVRLHAGIDDAQLDYLSEAARRTEDRMSPRQCPFCDDWEMKLQQANPEIAFDAFFTVKASHFMKHVGSHMRQLALFALPPEHLEVDEVASKAGSLATINDIEDTSSTSSSNKSDQQITNNDLENWLDNVQLENIAKASVFAVPGRSSTATSSVSPLLPIAETQSRALELSKSAAKEVYSTSDGNIPTYHQRYTPKYLFRIDEIKESGKATINKDSFGRWIPSSEPNANIKATGGTSGTWWCCDNSGISPLPDNKFPQGATSYRTMSVYYRGGSGYWILKGDATNLPAGEVWRPLSFEHDRNDHSSYITIAGSAHTLLVHRPAQQWPRMLLPDIYHNMSSNSRHNHGGLKGNLALFLALIAFSLPKRALEKNLSSLYNGRIWKAHDHQTGRVDKRGVVVYVYTCPPTWASASSAEELRRYESGEYGLYYN